MKILNHYRRTKYLRDGSGRAFGGISRVEIAAVVIPLIATLAVVTVSSLIASLANEKASDDQSLMHAVENATWRTTGSQVRLLEENVILEFSDQENENSTSSEILSHVCRQNGIEGMDCPGTLYAMAYQESRLGQAMIGDGGRSIGWFQIHRGFHPSVGDTCSMDLECSANWTLNRLISQGFLIDPDTAIMLHNGTPNTPKTLSYLASIKSKKALYPSK